MCLIHVEGLCVSLKNFLKHHALPSWLCCPRAPQGTQLETMELALNNNYYFWLHWVFVVVHGLCCSREAFPHCRKRGLLSLRCSLQWILLLQLVGSRARASIVVAHRFSCPVSCGILVPRLTKAQTRTPCITRRILKYWRAREVPAKESFYF